MIQTTQPTRQDTSQRASVRSKELTARKHSHPQHEYETVRTLMQIAADENLILHQRDVKSAYLQAPIDEDVYVTQPADYTVEEKVWKLNKSLYGLKQSGRNWHTMLHKYLLELNFNPSSADACLYIKRDNGETMILLIWVNDIIIAGSSNLAIDSIKQKLSSKFVFLDHSLESNSPNTKDVSPCLNQFTLKMC